MPTHTTTIRVRYSETDAQGIVHHSNYAIWMEIARLDLLKERGISFSQFSTYNVDATTYRIEVDYKKPVVYDDEIQIIVAVEELKKASLSFSYRILRGDCEVAAGRSMHAIVQSETSQPTRIPDAIRQILEDEPDQS